jgi:hypothetical protein
MKTGTATLTLDTGKIPKWLFDRMVKLAIPINKIIIQEYGQDEYLRRISDPFFFQSFINTLAFDWNSSGSTTVLTGVLKESLNKLNLGIKVAGGKGKASRKTPQEIENFSFQNNLSTQKTNSLIYASKISAKIDSNLVQDNYVLYHHSFIFTEKGKFAVIQQGMNTINSTARRYHWLSENISNNIIEPHNAICCDNKNKTLNLTSKKNEEARKCSLDLIKDNPLNLRKYLLPKNQVSLNNFIKKQEIKTLELPRDHEIDWEKVKQIYDIQPKNYEELVALKGIGAKTIRALALISKLVYGTEIDWKDPVAFSFTHGGKDGVPFYPNRKQYDKSIEILTDAVKQAEINNKEKIRIIKRLKDKI